MKYYRSFYSASMSATIIEIEKNSAVWAGNIQAIQTYIRLRFEIGLCDDVLLLAHPREHTKGLLEIDDTLIDGKWKPTLSITIRSPDRKNLRALIMNRHSLSMDSLRCNLLELLRLDGHLSATRVTAYNNDGIVEPAKPQQIGQGLANLYFFDVLCYILRNMENRAERWPALLPVVVIDLSNSPAFEKIGWISVSIDSSPEGSKEFLSIRLFRYACGGVPYTVIIEHPEALWTLKGLHMLGKLSQTEYDRELESFGTQLKGIIAAHNCLCAVHDGGSLAQHIESHVDKYKLGLNPPVYYGFEGFCADVFDLTENAEGGGFFLKDCFGAGGWLVDIDKVSAALKQEKLLSVEGEERLAKIASNSPHLQGEFVLQLLLFVLNLDSSVYARLPQAFEPSADAARSPPKALTRMQIQANILFSMSGGGDYYPYDFEVQLRKFVFEHKQDVSKLRNRDGLTLLQAIVTSNRPQFIGPLFRAGCWTDLKPLTAESGPYAGKTAEDICDNANARFRKVQKEMDVHQTWEKSLNQIHLAARKGDLAEVKRMLKFSQDLHHETDSMECTSLYWAVVGGNGDIVKLLMNLKVDHTKVNKRKESLLHIACIVGHAHLLVTLVKSFGMDWTVKDAAKKSPLLRVAENGDDKSLVKLMKCGLRKEKLGPILAIAGHYGRIGFLRKAIEDQGIDPGSKDDAGKSPFMRACEQGKLEVTKYLLTRGIDICETDTRRRNVLHMAADGAGVEMVEFLINEIRTRKGDDALRRMLCHRDKYIGGELCMLIRGKDTGRDSWHYVEVRRGLMDVFIKRTRSGTIDVAKYGNLLHSGWGVDPDEEAAREIEQLFESRRRDATEAHDVSPLHIAAFKDKGAVAEMLMEKGSDVDIKDKFGLTPLHVAAMRGNLAIVKGLLNRGAAPNLLDGLAKTPSDVAVDNEHPVVAGFIRSSQYIPVASNMCTRILPNILRSMENDKIQEQLDSGRDVRAYLISTLRDLSIDINESLVALGSGPIIEESS